MIYEIHTNKKHINTMTAPDEVCESIKRHFVQTCINTFPKTPYTWQTNVGSFILGCHLLTSPLKLLLVRPTGGGKTLVFTSVAACIKGITLCITPLLSLGADQVQKVMSKTSETDKSIIGFHLDELTDAQLLLDLQNYLSTPSPPPQPRPSFYSHCRNTSYLPTMALLPILRLKLYPRTKFVS